MASSTVNRSYIIPPLSASNYASWSIKIEMLLICSELWSVVDGTEPIPTSSDAAGLTAWQLKDSKARSDILLHCGLGQQLIALRPLKTSKEVWDRLKQTYEKSNKASQVQLHKQLCHMIMSDNEDVVAFLESWQALLQEAAISSCIFSEAQQVNLLLGALPESWSAFVTTQGGLADLTFVNLLSNILQQNAINLSKTEVSKSSAFYVKGKFMKPVFKETFPSGHRTRTQNENSRSYADKRMHSQKPSYPNHASFNRESFSRQIICHNCGIPDHKSPDCRKPKRNQVGPTKRHLHNYSSEEPHYLFSATVGHSDSSSAWYIDSGASQHMSPVQTLFRDYKALDTPRLILLGDNSSYNAIDIGCILLRLPNQQTFLIPDVLHVPGLAKNLISISQITSTGNTTLTFTRTQCVITTSPPNSKAETKFHLPKDGTLFTLGIGIEPSISANTAETSKQPALDTLKWHYRLGHINIRSLNIMKTYDMVIGLPTLKSTLSLCEGVYTVNKQRKLIRLIVQRELQCRLL